MGSIILCHKKKARNAYEISRIQRRIYTMEELCYYMCNHLYLIDYTIMNQKLCDWLEEELELKELADNLRQTIAQNGSAEQFVVTILAHSSIYTTAELKQIQDILEKLKNQKPIEKQKYKADNLLESGAVNQAILIYQSIVQDEIDESVDKKFYGRVYGCLGTAYGRMFLYQEAAKMYEAAFQICEDVSMLESTKLSFAVSNASPLAKKAAKYETVSNEEHAIAKIIYNLDKKKLAEMNAELGRTEE